MQWKIAGLSKLSSISQPNSHKVFTKKNRQFDSVFGQENFTNYSAFEKFSEFLLTTFISMIGHQSNVKQRPIRTPVPDFHVRI